MSLDRRLPEMIRVQFSNRQKFKPQTDRGELPEVGDIRLIRALSSQAQRLALILRVFAEFNYAEVCLLSNEVDIMSGFDALLQREETGLPFDLLAELDLTAPVYFIQACGLFGRLSSEELIRDLQNASEGDIESLRPGMRGQPIQGPSDPRWEYRERELAALQELSRECSYNLVEGKTEIRTLIDPALLDEVMTETELDPLEKSLELVAISEAALGGIASADQMTRLLEEFHDLFAIDPTLQLAVQPLLEAAISSEPPAVPVGSFKIGNRKCQTTEIDEEFNRLLDGALTDQSGPVLRIVTSERAWTRHLVETNPIPINIPGHGPVYADAMDPRRAA